MSLTVTVFAEGSTRTVTSLEELFENIKQFDPAVYVYIQFVNETAECTESVSATVDQ